MIKLNTLPIFLFLVELLVIPYAQAIHFSSSDPQLYEELLQITRMYPSVRKPDPFSHPLPQNPTNSCPQLALNKLCNFEYAVECTTNRTYNPSSVEEVQAIIKNAVAKGLRVRAMGHGHSDSAIWCDNEQSVAVFTDGLKKILNINLTSNTIEVEAGAMSGEVHDALHAVNRSLKAHYPAFRNLTLGGLISTGSYGSSLDTSSVLADSIVSLDLIDARGELLTFSTNDSLLRAARISLGTLGVIVRITLPIVEQFKIEMEVLTLPEEVMQRDDFINLIRNGTYVGFGWYPRARVIIVEHGRRVSRDTPGEGKAITFNPDPKFIEVFSTINEILLSQPELAPTVEIMVAKSQSRSPNYKYPHEKASVKVIGWSHQIMCGSCSDQCPWFFGLRSKESAYIFPLRLLTDLVQDIRQLLDEEAHRSLSFPLGGIYFRFGRPTTSLLGFGRDSEWFVPEVTTWRPRSGAPAFDQLGLEAIEALMRDKYRGLPHWGKNEDATFNELQRWKEKYGEDWQRFWQIQRTLDPTGVFLSSFISKFIQSSLS